MGGVKETRKELLLNLDRFEESLVQVIGGNRLKADLQKVWEKKSIWLSEDQRPQCQVPEI
jgi:hypothetical protein